MCGILGIIGQSQDAVLFARMLESIKQRGPDSQGEWYDEGVWLAHQRLAILDLSPNGHQPMLSECGRYVLAFNGEVYNFKEIRAELLSSGCTFRGDSDTEVVLAACALWGVCAAVRRFIGMFAFGFYDRHARSLWLARDPMGIKPLFYARSGGRFAFSSELTPLLELPWVDRSIDTDSLNTYFRYRCVPSPASIVSGVRKLPSASVLCWSNSHLEEEVYWSHSAIAEAPKEDESLSMKDAADQLEALLRDSVRMHMQSDVPYGAFLSGGVDSSAVVALMQAESSSRVSTFSIGFNENSHDESKYARAVAEYLGTDHHELILNVNDVPDIVPQVAQYYDEPFADSSSIPTWLVSQFARNSVKVCLSGDGGDELFGGYPRYFWANRIEGLRKGLGVNGCRMASGVLAGIPAGFWDGVIDPLTSRRFSSSEGLSHRVKRMANYLGSNRALAYADTMSVWQVPEVITGHQQTSLLGPDAREYLDFSWANEMMLIDQQCYLQDEILTKLDRASMAVSLEARVPLLTHPIVEWSWSIPDRLKFSGQEDCGKLVLREVLYRYIPRELIERPKQGFGMPLAKWLRGPLLEWALSLLNPADLEQCGLNSSVIHEIWTQHQAGQDHQAKIWTVLMYRQWHQRVMGF